MNTNFMLLYQEHKAPQPNLPKRCEFFSFTMRFFENQSQLLCHDCPSQNSKQARSTHMSTLPWLLGILGATLWAAHW